jgi:hypothetical protein
MESIAKKAIGAASKAKIFHEADVVAALVVLGEAQRPSTAAMITGGCETGCFGSRKAVAVARPIYGCRTGIGRSRSLKPPSGGPLGLAIPEMRRQHPERRHEDALRLLLDRIADAPLLASTGGATSWTPAACSV